MQLDLMLLFSSKHAIPVRSLVSLTRLSSQLLCIRSLQLGNLSNTWLWTVWVPYLGLNLDTRTCWQLCVRLPGILLHIHFAPLPLNEWLEHWLSSFLYLASQKCFSLTKVKILHRICLLKCLNNWTLNIINRQHIMLKVKAHLNAFIKHFKQSLLHPYCTELSGKVTGKRGCPGCC